MTTIANRSLRIVGIMLAAFALSTLPLVAPKAHAADLLGGDTYGNYYPTDYTYGNYYPTDYTYGNYYPSDSTYGNYYPTDYTYGNYYPTDYTYGNYYPSSGTYGNYYPDTSGNYYPDTSGNYYPDTYGNYYPDTYAYNNNYSSLPYNYGCSSCSASSPNYSYTYPTSYGYSYSNYSPTYDYTSSNYSPTYTYAPTNLTYSLPTTITDNGNTSACTAPGTCNTTYTYTDNSQTCTGGSCNTSTTINAPTNVSINSSTNSGQSYVPVYQPVPAYQSVAQPYYTAPLAYGGGPAAPYVSLSAVPYTGLDLGFWGTVAYWGFLILWCLGAAYLIVVKRVHNTLSAKLFGTKKAEAHPMPVAHVAHAPAAKAAPVATSQFGNIDPFIASQLTKFVS
jgi:hypothetical protein